jgi:hypothetical protein
MTPIVSPTTTERLVRLGIFLVLAVALAVWFVYDARVRYPRANVEALVQNFRPVPPDKEVDKLKSKINHAIGPASRELVAAGDTLEAVKQKLGEPSYVDQGEHGAYRYLGPGGLLTVNRTGNKVTSVQWTAGPRPPKDISLQWLYLGICGVLGLVTAVFLVSALRTRVVLNEDGLSMTPGPTLSWDQMKALKTDLYDRKGWVELEYESEGTTGEVRLDSYKIRDFKPLIAALCERKGFPSPLAGTAAPPGDSGPQQAPPVQ